MNHVEAIRLSFTRPDGSEHIQDFGNAFDARCAVDSEMSDWVIFEKVASGRYATCGRVLASVE